MTRAWRRRSWYLVAMNFYTDFAPHYERIFPFRPATLAFLRSWLPERGRVLDLGCGTGHYTGALAAAGLEAVGVDLDEAMIMAARERYSTALFVVEDLAQAPALVESADGAFCIGNVLPHLGYEALGAFLVDLAGVLPAGAPWVVQTVNFERLLPLETPHEFPSLDAGDGLGFARRYTAGDDGSVVFATRLLRDGTEVFRGEAVLWPLTSAELEALHRRAGFALTRQFGGFGGEAFAAAESGALVQVYRREG
ncbi:MAG: class I SAM-dependent methyltransferase [Candidatus Krumholzibacteriia bacterium]